MVNVMGRRVCYKIMETILNCTWAKSTAIKIIDMPESYKRALFEGPWKVADHYILVQR